MSVYYVNEAAFEIDDAAFDDRTVHVLASREELEGDVSLLVSRSRYRPGESLLDNVARHLERERRSFAGYRQLDLRQLRVDGAPAVDVSTRWRGAAGLVYQRQVHIGLERVVLLVVATGSVAEREACDAHVERALRTFRAREEGT